MDSRLLKKFLPTPNYVEFGALHPTWCRVPPPGRKPKLFLSTSSPEGCEGSSVLPDELALASPLQSL